MSLKLHGSIGVFDSGLGGLTILRWLRDALPQNNFIYFGDSGRAPYGNRSRATVTQFTEQAVNFLFDRGATMIIVACNTASTIALHHLQTKYLREPGVSHKKILGIVVPTAEAAVKHCRNGRLGVIGTRLTVESRTYEREVEKLGESLEVRSTACPLFVPLVEEGWEDTEVARLTAKSYLAELKAFECDSLVLGCTHFPYMMPVIQEYLGDQVRLIEQGPVVAEATRDYLHRHPEIASTLELESKCLFFTSGDVHTFESQGARYLHSPIHGTRRVTEAPVAPRDRHRALRLANGGDFEVGVPYGFNGRKESTQL